MTIQTLLSLFTPDVINGSFEFGGASAIGYNTYRLWKDKMVKGVSLPSTSFFTSWGIWNLFYYPHLNQPFSLAGGVAIVLTNATWLGLMWKYRKAQTSAVQTRTEMTLDEVCAVLDNQAQ